MKTAMLLLTVLLFITSLASAAPQGFGRFAAGFQGRGGGGRFSGGAGRGSFSRFGSRGRGRGFPFFSLFG